MGAGLKIRLSCVLLVGGMVGLAQAPGVSAAPSAGGRGITSPTARASRRVQVQEEACEFKIKLNVSYSCQLEFSVPSSHEYAVTVRGSPGHSGVEVIVQGPQGEAQYTDAKGKVTASSISASLGGLGKIAMRFRPGGAKRLKRIPSKCQKERPPSVSSQPGAFVGTFAFHGEQGYTDVVVHRARGGLGDPLTNVAGKPLTCSYSETDAERRKEDESVGLTVSPVLPHTSFSVSRLFGSLLRTAGRKGHDPFLFLVLESEKAHGLSILRSTGAVGAAASFTYDPALTTAAVKPPAPFTGTGTFRRNADGSTEWSGNLAVALPGLGPVALTPGTASLETLGEFLKKLEEELQPAN